MKQVLILLFSVIFWSCNDPESVKPLVIESTEPIEDFNLIVLNEGNFGSGSGSVSKVLLGDTSLKVENLAYFQQNNRHIGNVVQSMEVVNGEYWIVVNNSQKIVVTDQDFNHLTTLEGFNSPRYMVQTAEKVFVSDLFEDAIWVVSKSTQKIIATIPTGSWNEEMVLVGDELWVTNTDLKTISVFSTDDYQLLKTIHVKKQPLSIQKDTKGNVWALCNGGLLTREDLPYLYQINAGSYLKTDSTLLSSLRGLPSRMQVFEDDVYVLASNLYKLQNGQMSEVWDSGTRNFYGFLVTDEYYLVTDAKDFVRAGDLLVMDKQPTPNIRSATLDVIPSFIFRP